MGRCDCGRGYKGWGGVMVEGGAKGGEVSWWKGVG